jgi:hypothetical protein
MGRNGSSSHSHSHSGSANARAKAGKSRAKAGSSKAATTGRSAGQRTRFVRTQSFKFKEQHARLEKDNEEVRRRFAGLSVSSAG